MKKLSSNITVIIAIISFMGFCVNMTTPIKTLSILSESKVAQPGSSFKTVASESWTWTDFGGQVVGWAAGGAAGGAVAGGWSCCPAGAGAGAVTGGVAGAASGAAYYAGTQAWNYFFGSSTSPNSLSYSVAALD